MFLFRREFLKTSVQGLIGIALPPLGVEPLLLWPVDQTALQQNSHFVANKETRPATVAITQNHHIEHAIKEALAHLPVDALVRGKVVAVKPNDTFANEESTGAVTQPDTLKAVVHYLKQFEPRQLVVTGGSGRARPPKFLRWQG